MRLRLAALLVLFAPQVFAQSVPSIPFDSVPEPLKLPADMYLGEVSGVAVDSKGHVFVLQRGNTWTVCITPGPNQVLYSSDAFPAGSIR